MADKANSKKRKNNSPGIHVKSGLDGKVMVVEAPETIDLEMAKPLRATLADLVEQEHIRIVVDLHKTRYIDSSGLVALVSRIASLRARGGDLRLANPQERVNEILALTNLNKIIQSFDDLSTAVDSFK